MNFQVFNRQIKIFFLFTTLFLFLTIALFISYLVNLNNHNRVLFFSLFLWSGAATTLLINYLLWKNLPFLQKFSLSLSNSNNFVFFLILINYIIFFPLIIVLSLIFFLIFIISIFILMIMKMYKRKKEVS